MRTWMQTLTNQDRALDDFLDWCETSKANLHNQIVGDLVEGKIDQARNLAAQVVVYNMLQKTLKSHFNEHKQKVEKGL